jgi:hypothetical protein
MNDLPQLAQINVARMLAPLDSPVMAEFVANLESINALAEQSAGFVWRLQSGGGDATAIRAFDDPLILVNMSVWETMDALHDYVYRSAHGGVARKRRQWFEPIREPYYALWWVPRGHVPTIEEGKARLSHLARAGASAHAFWFGQAFAADGTSSPRPESRVVRRATD